MYQTHSQGEVTGTQWLAKKVSSCWLYQMKLSFYERDRKGISFLFAYIVLFCFSTCACDSKE